MCPLPLLLLDSLLAFSFSAFNGYYTYIYIHGLFKVTCASSVYNEYWTLCRFKYRIKDNCKISQSGFLLISTYFKGILHKGHISAFMGNPAFRAVSEACLQLSVAKSSTKNEIYTGCLKLKASCSSIKAIQFLFYKAQVRLNLLKFYFLFMHPICWGGLSLWD